MVRLTPDSGGFARLTLDEGFPVGKGAKVPMGASMAAGTHFSVLMVFHVRDQAVETTWLDTSELRTREPTTALGPDVPQVMFCGAGRGLTATASTRVPVPIRLAMTATPGRS